MSQTSPMAKTKLLFLNTVKTKSQRNASESNDETKAVCVWCFMRMCHELRNEKHVQVRSIYHMVLRPRPPSVLLMSPLTPSPLSWINYSMDSKWKKQNCNSLKTSQIWKTTSQFKHLIFLYSMWHLPSQFYTLITSIKATFFGVKPCH